MGVLFRSIDELKSNVSELSESASYRMSSRDLSSKSLHKMPNRSFCKFTICMLTEVKYKSANRHL